MTASAISGRLVIRRSLTTCEIRCASCEPGVAWQPDVHVDEHVVRRSAAANLVTSDHAGHAHHHAAHILFRHDDAIGQDALDVAGNLVAGVTDEARDEQSRQRIQQGIAGGDADECHDDGDGGQHVAPRVTGVGEQHFTLQAQTLTMLVARDGDVDDERHDHHRERDRSDFDLGALTQAFDHRSHHFDHHQQQ